MTTPPILTLDSFKLDTVFCDNGVVHHQPDNVDEVWTEVEVIGHGGQGTVYLQQLDTGSTRLVRAVKKLSKEVMRASRTVNAMHEVNVMMAVRDVRSPSSLVDGRGRDVDVVD